MYLRFSRLKSLFTFPSSYQFCTNDTECIVDVDSVIGANSRLPVFYTKLTYTFSSNGVEISVHAEKNAKFVASLFGFDVAETECGVEAGSLCFGKEESDAKGCIVISTLNGNRAKAYLERLGAEIDPDIWYDKKGNVSCFGLKDTVAGFEVCIETK